MNEYASKVANSIKFVVAEEWVDASSDASVDVISPSIEHGLAEHAIIGLGPAAGSMSKLAGCAVQQVSIAAYCAEYFVSYLTHLCRGVGRASGSGPLSADEMVHRTCVTIQLGKSVPEIEGETVMFTNANIATTSVPPGCTRRLLLGMVVIAVAVQSWRALAETVPADAVSTIQRFNGALLIAMKSGGQTDFSHRFQALAPEVDQAFDLSAVLSVSVGPSWASFSPDQQSRLLVAFRRYTVASYVANFDGYAGQDFTVSPDTRSLGVDRVVVQSRIAKISGDATELDYVMKQTPLGWKVVDVLAGGSISRVAVQRSDFRRILSNGGDALLASLQRKASDLSGGALAYRMSGNFLQ